MVKEGHKLIPLRVQSFGATNKKVLSWVAAHLTSKGGAPKAGPLEMTVIAGRLIRE